MSGLSGGNMAGASNDLLEVLKNPEVFKKRLEQLQETERKTQAVVDLAGPADEIVRIRKQIEKDKTASEEELTAAQADTAEMMETAQANASTIVVQAQAEAEEIIAAAKELTIKSEEVNQAAIKVSQTAVEQMKHVEQREKNLQVEWENYRGAEAALQDLETELLQEKSKLATAREHIDQALR